MKNSKRLLALAVSAAIAAPMAAHATNGMNLEGYGPIATGMGGASMAYDNGTAAMMNNPATLALMDDGARLDVALGQLSPDISASLTAMPTMSWGSGSDSFLMPAVGYATKNGKLTWGVGGFAQGGMGTEYNSQVDMGGGAYASSPGGAAILAEGVLSDPTVLQEVMNVDEFSEVGVMRIMVPVAYNVDEKLTVAGSIDFVRATMDIRMAMPGSAMGAMAAKDPTAGGTLDGTMLAALSMFDGGVAGGYFDFADSNDYSGATTGSGFAGKLGFTYKVNDALTLGGTYHTKTALGDLEGSAEVSIAGVTTMGGMIPATDMIATVDGDIKIKNFQWPTTIGFGVSYKPADKWMIAADIKRINWSEVMDDFQMSFVASNSASNTAMGVNGATLDAVLFQDWDDQNVIQIGGSYQATEKLVVRAGLNKADNPIPDSYLNHLFPATIKDHYTLGFGYTFNPVSEFNFAYTYAPEVSVDAASGMTIDHSQSNWQMMYSHKF